MRQSIGAVSVGLILAFGLCANGQPYCHGDFQEPGVDCEAWALCMGMAALRQAENPADSADALARAFDTFSQYRERAFSSMLHALMSAGRADEAKARYLDAVRDDPRLARGAYGAISNKLRADNDMPALIEWTGALTGSPLPDDLVAASFSAHIEACVQGGDIKKAIEAVPACLSRLGPAEGSRMVYGLISGLLDKRKFDDARAVIAVLEKSGEKEPKALAAAETANLLFLQEKWDEAEKQLRASAPAMSDEALARSVSVAAKKAFECGKPDLVERIAEWTLKECPGKAGARREAASQFVKAAAVKNAFAQIPARIEQLMAMGLERDAVYSIFEQNFYIVLKGENKDEIKAMLAIAGKLMPMYDKDDGRGRIYVMLLQSMILDGTFMVEDYDGAIALIENDYGVWEKDDEEWRKAAINKIEAHAALKRGDKDEAVRRFREFMNSIDVFDHMGQEDPMTGLTHTKEMTLGLNARRIGDILVSIGKKTEASQAYAEAAQYYAKAMTEVKSGGKEAEYIKTELDKIPKGP